MSDPQSGNGKPPDPFEQWRISRDAYVAALSKALNDVLKNGSLKNGPLNSDSCTQTTDAVLETLLTASAPFRETLQKITTITLEQLGIPSRDDFDGLSERMSNFEAHLDDLQTTLNRIELLLSRPAPRAHKPTRVRAAKTRAT